MTFVYKTYNQTQSKRLYNEISSNKLDEKKYCDFSRITNVIKFYLFICPFCLFVCLAAEDL